MYSIIDFIADLYLPVLLLCFLIACVRALKAHRYTMIRKGWALLIITLAISYGLMFLDHQWSLFANFSLDYSTHTAVALSGVLTLYYMAGKLPVLSASFLLYLMLMMYQRYHTLSDIVTTLLLTTPIMVMAYKKCTP